MEQLNLNLNIIKATLFSIERATNKTAVFSIEKMDFFELIGSNETVFHIKSLLEGVADFNIPYQDAIRLLNFQEISNNSEIANYKSFKEKVSDNNQITIIL